MSKISLNTSFTGLTVLKDWWGVVKSNFLAIVTGHNDLESRVDNMVSYSGSSNQEIVDARNSGVKSKIFATLDGRLEEAESDYAAHKADLVTDTDGAHGLKIEEGTFTPAFSGQTTHTYQYGFYTKFNKVVHFEIMLGIGAKDAGFTGNVVVSGLPFLSRNVVGQHYAFSISRASYINFGGKQLSAYMENNQSTIQLLLSGDGGAFTALQASAISTDASLRICGTYKTA